MDARADLIKRASSWVRWRWLLASCRYDPTADHHLEEPAGRDFIIAGCPRSGTSLLAAQLFRPPEVVTCMEPWDGMRMPVAHLMRSLRQELESGYLSRGRLDLEVLADQKRVAWIREGEQRFPVSVEVEFQLGVKWPAFWRYLPLLEETRFLICVRDPVEVVASFGHTGGRLGRGYDYDVAFNREMNRFLRSATGDEVVRRALMWEYIHSRILPHLDRPNVMVVRYERWFTEPDAVLGEVGRFLGLELKGSTVIIQPPESKGDGRVRALVRDHCPSAELFGYGP